MFSDIDGDFYFTRNSLVNLTPSDFSAHESIIFKKICSSFAYSKENLYLCAEISKKQLFKYLQQ